MRTPDQKKSTSHHRRALLKALFALPGLSLLSRPALAAIQTPRAAAGPYYPSPKMRLDDLDNDLVKIAGSVRQAGGEIIQLSGTVRDQSGIPMSGARVEIWQCDVNGRYLHTGDNASGQRDPAFQGFGHDITDADGRYEFRTIKPVPYTGRTPHIHVKVFFDGKKLTTQFYLKDHAQNRSDFLFNRMSEVEKSAVEMVFSDGPEPLALVDIVI